MEVLSLDSAGAYHVDSVGSGLHIGHMDTVFYDTTTLRYFLIAYQCMSKTDHIPITGNVWFTSSGFPNKKKIDLMVYASFLKRKECYQPVLVLNIYEFKNYMDYMMYTSDYHGQKNPKKKEPCCVVCPTDTVPWKPMYFKNRQDRL